MKKFNVAETIEDAEFLNDTGTIATLAAERLGFASPSAMEKWLERHGRYDLWLAMKAREPEGTHHHTPAKREGRRLMSVTTSTDTYANLLENGKASSRAHTRRKAERAADLLHDLRVILNAESEEDERRHQAATEVERLTRELAEAKARLRGGSATTLDVDSSVSAADLRKWAQENGIECPAMGRVPASVREAYDAAEEVTA